MSMWYLPAAGQFRYAQVKFESSLMQRHDGCWWFGQPGRCGSWNALIATFIVAASMDVLFVMTMLLLGTETSSKSNRMKRYCSLSTV